MEWYYEKDGEQQGPIDEGTLKAFAATGKIAPDCRVWCETMRDWAEYSSVFPS